MTIPVPTVPAVRAALYTALVAACTPDTDVDLLVRYDEPGPYQPEDIVSVGDVTTRTTEPLAMVGGMGALALNEAYSVEVVIDVCRSGDDPGQVTTERAWALEAQVETVVRTDPTFGGNTWIARPGQSRSESEWTEDHGWFRVRITVSVDVEAAI